MISEVLKKYGPIGVQVLINFAPNKTGETDKSIRFVSDKDGLFLIAGGYYNRRYRDGVDTYEVALTEFVEELTEAVKTDQVNSMKEEVMGVWH